MDRGYAPFLFLTSTGPILRSGTIPLRPSSDTLCKRPSTTLQRQVRVAGFWLTESNGCDQKCFTLRCKTLSTPSCHPSSACCRQERSEYERSYCLDMKTETVQSTCMFTSGTKIRFRTALTIAAAAVSRMARRMNHLVAKSEWHQLAASTQANAQESRPRYTRLSQLLASDLPQM